MYTGGQPPKMPTRATPTPSAQPDIPSRPQGMGMGMIGLPTAKASSGYIQILIRSNNDFI